MRFVLSGYYGFDNVGDEAILLSIINALKRVNPYVKITVLSNNPDKTAETYNVDAVDRWKLSQVYGAIRQADGVISGGGSLLQDKTGLKSIPYYTGVMMLATLLKKPFYIYAQGIGPVIRPLFQRWIKRVMEKSAFLSVRDEDSLQLLKTFGVKKGIELVPDPVIGLDPSGFTQKWTNDMGINKPFVTFSVRDWPSEQPFLEKVADVIKQLYKSGVEVIFVPMHGKHDDETSKQVIRLVGEPVHLFPYDASIEEKIAVINDSVLLIGMRLHALIFAALTYTPMIGISYDPKIDSFLKQVQQPSIGHVDETWSANDLSNLVEKQLLDSDNQAKQLQEHVERLKEKANQTAQRVMDDLE